VSSADLPGAELARVFYSDVVQPLLASAVPRLRYAAARLGSGSDVLGLDDATSRDHDWGCRLTLLVDDRDADAIPLISQLLERELPERYRDYPVRFAVTWDASATHKVEVATVTGFAASRLGIDPSAGLSVLDWLTLTGQGILEVTAGPVFADRTQTLAPIRALLRWYPRDIERYVLAAGWQRISQQLPLVGRTAECGDQLGSRLISATLSHDLMSLAFALSKRWSPYLKWRGTLFQALPSAESLTPLLSAAAAATGWREREEAIVAGAGLLLEIQRERGLPAPASAITQFFDRPFRAIHEAVPDTLLAGITDPQVLALPRFAGSIEQWVDSADVLSSPDRRSALQAAYRAWTGSG
jgi:Domain of unknown function (DUF4037)